MLHDAILCLSGLESNLILSVFGRKRDWIFERTKVRMALKSYPFLCDTAQLGKYV